MNMMLETPREAALRAENDRLKAENAYLRRAIDPGGRLHFTPVAAIEEMTVPVLNEGQELRLPAIASVHGGLSRYGDYHVLARLSHSRAAPENLLVQYHAPAEAIKGKADYWPNELFPYLHQRFIAALANAIHPPRQEVA